MRQDRMRNWRFTNADYFMVISFHKLNGHLKRGSCLTKLPVSFRVKRGEDLVSSKEKGLEIGSDGDNYILTIDSTKLDDAGTFNIVAANRAGKISGKAELVVHGKYLQCSFMVSVGCFFKFCNFFQQLLHDLFER